MHAWLRSLDWQHIKCVVLDCYCQNCPQSLLCHIALVSHVPFLKSPPLTPSPPPPSTKEINKIEKTI